MATNQAHEQRPLTRMIKSTPMIWVLIALSWSAAPRPASAQAAPSSAPVAPTAVARTEPRDDVTFCDRYAASEFDVRSPVLGLPFDRVDPKAAIPACREALSRNPNSPRLNYEMARAYAANREYSKALEFFYHAADANFALAQLNIGSLYFSGLGVPKDHDEAAKWTRAAADQGLAPAQGNLGEMFLRGEGVPQDYALAARWLALAASQGYAPAETSLAALYVSGKGVKQDFEQAAALNARAASQGYAPALANLGSFAAIGDFLNENYGAAEAGPAPAPEQSQAPVEAGAAPPASSAMAAAPSVGDDEAAPRSAPPPDSLPASAGATVQVENPPARPAQELALNAASGAPSAGETAAPARIALKMLDHRHSSGVPIAAIEVSPLSNEFSMNSLSVNAGDCPIYAHDPATFFLLMRRAVDLGSRAAKDNSNAVDDGKLKQLALQYIPLPSPFNQPMTAEFGQYLQFYVDPSACEIKEVQVVINGKAWEWRQ
jgi:hypothetical protein